MKLYFMQDGTRMYVKDHSQLIKEGSADKPKVNSSELRWNLLKYHNFV